jgi:hypothetical protein
VKILLVQWNGVNTLEITQITSCKCHCPNVHPPLKHTESAQDPTQKIRGTGFDCGCWIYDGVEALFKHFFSSTAIRRSLGSSGLDTSMAMELH